MTDVVVLALIEDPMSFIDSKTVFTVHLQEKKGRWRNKRWRGGGRIYKSQGGKLQCSISSWKPPTRSHAGTSALDTFIIVERHRTTPPPLSANPFLTIFTEKHTGFKYLGIMHIPLFLSFVLDNSQRHGVIFTGFFYMHSAVECQPHITAGFLLRSVSHVITS